MPLSNRSRWLICARRQAVVGCVAVVIAGMAFGAGPVDFGMAELDASIAARNFKYKPKILAELDIQAPETFRIEPYSAGGGHITGGDLRGLMYGLLEAAQQMRANGRLKMTHGAPGLALRGVRITANLTAGWFGSSEFWDEYLGSLARGRFNRLELVLNSVVEGPGLPALRMITETAQQYGVDVAIGFTAPSIAAIQSLLTNCPAVHAIALRGGPLPATAELLRTLHDSGRRVVLELPDNEENSALIEAAGRSGAPLRLFAPFSEASNPQPRDSYVDVKPSEGVDVVKAISGAGFEVSSPLDAAGKPSLDEIGTWGQAGYNRATK